LTPCTPNELTIAFYQEHNMYLFLPSIFTGELENGILASGVLIKLDTCKKRRIQSRSQLPITKRAGDWNEFIRINVITKLSYDMKQHVEIIICVKFDVI